MLVLKPFHYEVTEVQTTVALSLLKCVSQDSRYIRVVSVIAVASEITPSAIFFTRKRLLSYKLHST